MDKACPIPRPFRSVLGSVVFVTLLFFLTFIGRFIFSPLMPAISEDVAITSAQVGSVFLVGAFGLLAGSFAAPFVSARTDHRGSLLTSAFGVAAVLGLSSLADSVWALRGVMLVMGVFAGISQPSVFATITAMVRRQEWGKALSVQQVAPPLSLVAGPLVAVGLLSVFSWRVSLVCVGIFAAAVGCVLLGFRSLGDFPGERPRPELVRLIVHGRSIWLMILLLALGMGAQVGVYTMLPLYLTQEKGMSASSANTLLGLANLSPLVMVFVAGWIADRIGVRWTILSSLVLTGLVTILLGVLDGIGLEVAIFLLPAFAVCVFPPAFSALSRIVQPNLRSVAAAFAPPSAFLVGGGLLPAMLGYMGQTYTFALGFVITGVSIMVGSVAALFLKLLAEEEMEEGC